MKHPEKKGLAQSETLFGYYLLENCGARRAAFKPYFFLSFIRGSLVKKPALLSTGL
jgi:hypothetical protein